MEPITKVSHIPSSRWALVCSLCNEKVGASIQVNEWNKYPRALLCRFLVDRQNMYSQYTLLGFLCVSKDFSSHTVPLDVGVPLLSRKI